MIKETKVFRGVSSTLETLSRPAYERLHRHKAKIQIMSRILATLVGALIVWDVLLATNELTGDTWSEQARLAAPRLPVLPWILGAMIGHLFPLFRRRTFLFEQEAAGSAMGVLTVLAVIWTALIQFGVELPISPPAVWVIAVLGLCGSYLFWPLRLTPQTGEAR